MSRTSTRRDRGAALAVGLIMLVLITVMLLTALNLGTANFRSVGNQQFRDEAISAANVAIQERLSSTFDEPPATSVANVDIDNDGNPDYSVEVTPTCIGATQVFVGKKSSIKLGKGMSAPPVWSTTWDISATVNDARTGAAVRVRAGSRVQLSDADKQRSCL